MPPRGTKIIRLIMARPSALDTQWQRLMALCTAEKRFRSEGHHPKLLMIVKGDIDELAREMGFSDRLIATRDFRAERNGAHITRIITE